MSRFESAFCRSSAWGSVTRRLVLPWALRGAHPAGDVLEIGGGAGEMGEGVRRRSPDGRLTVIGAGELRAVLADLRLEAVTVEPVLLGRSARFSAQRPPASDAAS